MNRKTLSVVIATFNSQQHLPRVIRSLRQQKVDDFSIEILIVDGGSTDNTLTIAKQFKCKVLKNPRVLPAWAKYIGYQKAKSNYVMYLDSDEELMNQDSLMRKLSLLRGKVRAVTGSGYQNPQSFSWVNRYVNEFGDPFSFFVYRLSKDDKYFLPTMKSRYRIVSETSGHVVFDFTKERELPIFELVAMGSIVDRAYMKKQFPMIDRRPDLIPHMFYLLVAKKTYVGIVKHDPIMHFSVGSMSKLTRKIKSRVIANVFSPSTEGFQGRSKIGRLPTWKKYLFLPYAFTLVGPLLDAIYLSFSRSQIGYLLHVPLVLYTALLILYYTLARIVGLTYKVQKYG